MGMQGEGDTGHPLAFRQVLEMLTLWLEEISAFQLRLTIFNLV